jgi:Domain of unknown function (DUF4365)
MPGFTHGYHEGSRSEYLAAYVFSAFGTASAIPHQEDHGFDLYCTLAQGKGRTRFAFKPYTVQVKSTRDPWVFKNRESVEWFVNHPLPMFLCVVSKAERRFTVFQTTPKYYYWTFGSPLPERLVLCPDFAAAEGECKYWQEPGSGALSAPLLDFTLDQLADDDFFEQVREVLDSWIDLEYENLFQQRTGTRQWISPHKYQPNEPIDPALTGWCYQSGPAATVSEPRQTMAVLRHSLAWVMDQSAKCSKSACSSFWQQAGHWHS